MKRRDLIKAAAGVSVVGSIPALGLFGHDAFDEIAKNFKFLTVPYDDVYDYPYFPENTHMHVGGRG